MRWSWSGVASGRSGGSDDEVVDAEVGRRLTR